MIKNAILYRIAPEFVISSDLFANNMEAAAFAPCGATQEISAGWGPPRGEAHGALVESIGGHLIAKLMIETKAVPSELVKRKAAQYPRIVGMAKDMTPQWGKHPRFCAYCHDPATHRITLQVNHLPNENELRDVCAVHAVALPDNAGGKPIEKSD